MLKSSEPLTVDGGHADLSFAGSSWKVVGGIGINMISMGDEVAGPLAELYSIAAPAEPYDVKAGLDAGWVHQHHSDTFRIVLRGDLIVGRSIYSPEDFRVQQADAYYGPEAQGPTCAAGSEMWIMILFADRRGYPNLGANPKDHPMIAEIEAPFIPVYEAAGAGATHPADASVAPGVVTTLDAPLHAGHVDGSLAETETWATVGSTRMASCALGDPTVGPLVLVSATPGGAVALPALTCASEVLTLIVTGSAEMGGVAYPSGGVRIQEPGVPHPAVVAGSDGLRAVTVIADRRAATPTVDESDADARKWAKELRDLTRQVLVAPQLA